MRMNSHSTRTYRGVRHTVVGLCFALLFTGCQKSSEQPPTADTVPAVSQMKPVELTPGVLEPGVGVKDLKLGQSRTDAEALLGAPSGQDSNEFVKGQTYLLFHGSGVELTLQDDKIEMITLHGEYKEWKPFTGGTSEGVGVSSTAQEVTQAFGPSSDEAPRALRYPDKGIYFRFDVDRKEDGSNARVESLSIVSPESVK